MDKTGGLLLVDKPHGWTSFDVANKVRGLAQAAGLNTTGRKRYPVGHTGTLDPAATGLLVVLLGSYTKKATALTKVNKVYEVTMRLGLTSTTGDSEGELTDISADVPTHHELEAALQSYVGDIMQRPPVFSAIKVNGQRSYDLARKGNAPELQPRPVHIEYITHITYDYPYASFTTQVSSGTYIRSLVEDVGKTLRVGAYMSALRRTAVGTYSIRDAVVMSELTPDVLIQKITQIDSQD